MQGGGIDQTTRTDSSDIKLQLGPPSSCTSFVTIDTQIIEELIPYLSSTYSERWPGSIRIDDFARGLDRSIEDHS